MSKAAFLLSKHQLESRFRQLGQTLNAEMGFNNARLRFRSNQDQHGLSHWWLENATLSEFEQGRFPGVAAQLATAPGDASQLYFAFAEQWVYVRRAYAFKSSNLKFIVSDTDPNSLPIQFRLEWAGRDPTAGFTFNGIGAAHPHWNFDANRSWIGQGGEVQVDLEPQPQIVDLDLDDAEASVPIAHSVQDGLNWFHKLHLPARANWNDALRQVHLEAEGQQHDPASVVEIDNWVRSALRYLRHEFTLYAA